MVAERRFSSPENYAYLALLFSLLRPELQGYLKLEQDAVNPAIASITNPYNLTGLAFSGSAPYGTNYGNNLNNIIPSKESIAASGYYDPFSQYLGWQPNTQFNNSGIAMILGDTQVRSHLDSESGYSSADEVRSPLSTSSYSSHSPRQVLDDLSDLGAAGYTPPSTDYVHSLEDYVDLEQLANAEPFRTTKGHFDVANQDLPFSLKQEPDYLLDKLLGPEAYSTDFKTSPGGNDFPSDFELVAKDLDPFGIDFDQTLTNSSFQYPLGNDLESMIDFDALDSLDFTLPSDILTTDQSIDPSSNIESQLQNLIQNPTPLRNGSGGRYPNDLTTVTPLGDSKKLTNNPTTSTMVVSNKKKIAASKKKIPATKKMVSTEPKSVKLELPIVDISDDDIADLEVNEFNAYLETLTEEQAKYVRDVRRRGKNKEAARICRKRKLEAIDGLDDELKKLKLEKQRVLDERRAILEETSSLKSKLNELEASVFSSFKDDNGLPLSSSEYSLFQGANGTMYIGKNIDNAGKKQKST